MTVPANIIANQDAVSADQWNTYAQWVANATQLRVFPGAYTMIVYSCGYIEPNDGGQGYYYWSGLSTLADDGKNVIQPYGFFYGRWIRLSGSGSVNCGTCNTLANPIVQLDFCKGLYSVNGASYNPAQVLDKPGFISNGSLQLRTLGGSANSDLEFIIGDALTAVDGNTLLTQVTIVIDWTEINADPSKAATLFTIQNSGLTSLISIVRAASPRYLTFTVTAPTGGSNTATTSPTTIALGRHRLAVTITNNELTASVDGASNIVGGTNLLSGFSSTLALFGGQNGGNLACPININSLYVYNPRTM